VLCGIGISGRVQGDNLGVLGQLSGIWVRGADLAIFLFFPLAAISVWATLRAIVRRPTR
jgi:hypothetical protein